MIAKKIEGIEWGKMEHPTEAKHIYFALGESNTNRKPLLFVLRAHFLMHQYSICDYSLRLRNGGCRSDW
jgi:hypothetical protein